MTIAERVYSEIEIGPSFKDYRHDILSLTWEERRQGHGKRRSMSGFEFAISLPSGTILKQGDLFILEPDRTIVTVHETPEPVYIVRPKTSQEWAFYAYHVGNRHQQVMIGQTELIFLQNPAVRSLLEQLHVHFDLAERPFTAALANVGHSH
jgi:urease accessory protein